MTLGVQHVPPFELTDFPSMSQKNAAFNFDLKVPALKSTTAKYATRLARACMSMTLIVAAERF